MTLHELMTHLQEAIDAYGPECGIEVYVDDISSFRAISTVYSIMDAELHLEPPHNRLVIIGV